MLYSKRRKNLGGGGRRKRSNRRSYGLKHINSVLTRIKQKGGGTYIFKSRSSKTIENLIAYLKKTDLNSSFELKYTLDTLEYNNIDPSNMQTMTNLLNTHHRDANISININNFTVSGLNLISIPPMELFRTIPQSINLRTNSYTTYSYTITTNSKAEYKDYLEKTNRLELIRDNNL
jgi:hypothetical protein